MIDDEAALVGVGVERVGIIAQSGDGQRELGQQAANPARFLVGEMADIDVGDAGIAAVGLAGRPAHQLHAGEPFSGREGQDFFQAQISEDGADESQLHDAPSLFPFNFSAKCGEVAGLRAEPALRTGSLYKNTFSSHFRDAPSQLSIMRYSWQEFSYLSFSGA